MKNTDHRYVKERKDFVYKYKEQPYPFITRKNTKWQYTDKTSGIIRILTRQWKREREYKQNLN